MFSANYKPSVPGIVLGVLILILAWPAVGGTLPKGVIRLPGTVAPPLPLRDIDGKPAPKLPIKDRWAFVHFWASWCSPCRREMPTIQKLSEETQNDPIDILLINTAESEDTVFSFLGIVAPDLTPLMDLDGQVTEKWQPRGLPSTYLVDPQGKLRYLVLGGRDWTQPEYLQFIKSLGSPGSNP